MQALYVCPFYNARVKERDLGLFLYLQKSLFLNLFICFRL